MDSPSQLGPNKQPPPPYEDIGWRPSPPQEGQQNSSESQPRPPMVITSGPRVDAAYSPAIGQQFAINYGPNSQFTRCPHCCQPINTSVETRASNRTHLIALAICCIGCCLCAWLPYTIDSCQSINHSCPSCGAYLGSYND